MKTTWLKPITALALTCIGSTAVFADAIIAPFFDTRGTSNTFVSVVTKDPQNLGPGVTDITTHWVYLFKNLANNNEQCQHSDGNGQQTVNDLGTFDLKNRQTMVETGTTSTAHTIAPGFAGMFTIWNNSNVGASENSLAGEVIFLSDGRVGSYRMLNDPAGVSEGNFDDAGYGAFGISTFPNTPPGQGPGFVEQPPLLIWHPTAILTTQWLISVLDANMDEIPVPNMAVELALADADFVNGAFYDRDENRNSTSQTVEMACLARVGLSDLIDAGGLLDAQTEGGWAHLGIVDLDTADVAIDPPFSIDRSIIVSKLESHPAGIHLFTSENRYDF
jgi:hypothetical protein